MNDPILINRLMSSDAFPDAVDSPIEFHETHISMIVLAGEFAYKLKKPVKTDFLDYSTLEKRHHACLEELRLGVRYADDLYLAVVPIINRNGRIAIEQNEPQPNEHDVCVVEYALKMRRFPTDALLSQQLMQDAVSLSDLQAVAVSVAAFHRRASIITKHDDQTLREPLHQAILNFKPLHGEVLATRQPHVQELRKWTSDTFEQSIELFRHRLRDGFVRECHGDLHCDNVVKWRGRWVPFDGIEFNSALSWIDVLDDASFLMMDLDAREKPQLARGFINAYLEQTGDYTDLLLLRWFAVYRALVRAKVAMIRSSQLLCDSPEYAEQITIANRRIDLAYRYMRHQPATLWITHGVSGSGKSTGSESIVLEQGAIRIRSDVERKRLFGMAAKDRTSDGVDTGIYSLDASVQTYDRLYTCAKQILQAGYSVVVDATFLHRADRSRFHQLAILQGVEFKILACFADAQILRDRISARRASGQDPSDANLAVLEEQLVNYQSLHPDEEHFVIRRVAEAPASVNERMQLDDLTKENR